MEVTADLIKFDLLKNRSPQEIFEEIFENDSLSDDIFVLSAYELPGGWSDSALYFGTTGDAVKKLSEMDSSQPQRKGIYQGFARLFVYESMPDELDLRSVPDENYIASFSPMAAREVLSHLTEPAELGLLNELSKSEFSENFGAYLKQWRVLLESASAKNLGILVHLG